VPRDATATRERIVRTATDLFARRGIHAVTVRELTEAAGQRNASALHYHFGSRDGLLRAILERHQAVIDTARAGLLEDAHDLHGFVQALVVPLAEALRTRQGRAYLRVIAQVFAEMGIGETPVTGPPNARRAVEGMVAGLADLPEAVRTVRIAHALLLVTEALAHRARLLDARLRVQLDHDAFVADLVTTIAGALTAR
jgi:TetR/AcrR family transcriptional regulator, regulator of cefoperazone and chloramphenicol sensitivity